MPMQPVPDTEYDTVDRSEYNMYTYRGYCDQNGEPHMYVVKTLDNKHGREGFTPPEKQVISYFSSDNGREFYVPPNYTPSAAVHLHHNDPMVKKHSQKNKEIISRRYKKLYDDESDQPIYVRRGDREHPTRGKKDHLTRGNTRKLDRGDKTQIRGRTAYLLSGHNI